MRGRVDDMDRVVWSVVIALVLGLVIVLVVDGQDALTQTGKHIGIAPTDCPYVGDDLTDLLYEAYAVYGVDMDRWREIRREMWRRVGAPVRFYGVYAHDGRWVTVSRRSEGWYLVTGLDWTRGADGQLHDPLCAVVVEALPVRLYELVTD